MKLTRTKYIKDHILPSFVGALSVHPRLTFERLRYALTRKFRAFRSNGMWIEHPNQLLTYWEMWAEREVFKDWPEKVGDTPLIYDIGANCGMFGVVCRRLFPNATIIGFEPISEMRRMAEQTGAYTRLHSEALSDSAGRAQLKLTEGEVMSANLGGAIDYTGEIREVDVARLDELGLSLYPDVIKIDVDGGEMRVLYGGIMTLRGARFLIVETTREGAVYIAGMTGTRVKKVSANDYLFYPR